MRGLVAGLLLVLTGILSIAANAGVWVNRAVYDTDEFVATTDRTLDDSDVQEAIAERFSDELYVSADVQGRLETQLPEGLRFLALPLGNSARQFLNEATLRLLERQRLEDVRSEALTRTHARLLAFIEDDSGSISADGGALVLDLRPVLERVAEDVTRRDVDAGALREGGAEAPDIPESVLEQLPPDARAQLEQRREDGFLSRLELGEDAGRFVIDDRSIAWLYTMARYGNDVVWVVVGLTVACYALAIGITLAAMLLLFWPELNVRFVVMVLALTFVCLAGIELAGAKEGESGEQAR